MIFCSLASPLAAETLTLGGTGAALGGMRLVGDAYQQENPGAKVVVLPSLSSRGGVKALISGKIDIALTARPLKGKELDHGLVEVPYATTPVVLATPRKNAAEGLTTAELLKIVTGEVSKWPDGTEMGLVVRLPNSAETRILEEFHPEMKAALEGARERPGVPIAYTVQEAADLIQAHPGGLGTASLSLILAEERPLKVLALDGVMPSPETVAAGQYKFIKAFNYVTGPETRDAVGAFLTFLRSPVAAALLEESGHAVVSP